MVGCPFMEAEYTTSKLLFGAVGRTTWAARMKVVVPKCGKRFFACKLAVWEATSSNWLLDHLGGVLMVDVQVHEWYSNTGAPPLHMALYDGILYYIYQPSSQKPNVVPLIKSCIN